MTQIPRTAIIALTTTVFSLLLAGSTLAADAPKDRVVAMYFHRTQRCPTCQKMGSYSEEAVKKGFAKQLKEGTVAFHLIDFQDAKNTALTKGYRIEGPALIVAKIRNNKVESYKNLKDIWTNVADKPAFLKYVKENVTASLK